MKFKSFYKEIYFNSLLPYEVLIFRKKNYLFSIKKEPLYYLELWKKSISKNASDADFKKYCSLNRLSMKDVFMMTSTIFDYKDEINFPFWLDTLKTVLHTINERDLINVEMSKEISFNHLLYPFANHFILKLKNNLKISNINLPNKKVLNQLRITLCKDLHSMSVLAFADEYSIFLKKKGIDDENNSFYYQKFVTKVISNGFKDIFLKYPMLARKLATKTHRYVEFITNICKRLDKDRSEINFFFNTKISEIKNIHLNLGEQHNGETTTILEFENSYKIVYKPTNISITLAYNYFINWVNVSLKEELKTFKVLDKQEYGWLEYVENLGCVNDSEIEAYYERAGIIAGIAYFLNARDYHFENIIASGNSPVLIDHETIIVADVENSTFETKGTILESHLLPGNDDKNKKICGFGSSIQRRINSHNIPKLKGEKCYLRNFQSEFKIGFYKLYNLILDNKEFLLSQNSPLGKFKNKEVRYIFRATEVYGKILRSLNRPEYLSDSIKYGIRLELLGRAFLKNGKYISILESEREQMTIEDIPVFYTNTLSKKLILPNKNEVAIFERNAIKSVENKIKKASAEDYQEQLKLINKAIIL